MQEFKHIPGLSLFSAILTEELLKGKEGDVLTDEFLGSLIEGKSTSVHGEGYGFLVTAVKRSLRMGIVWSRIRGANAIKCLGGVEKLAYGKQKTAEIARKAKKTYSVLKTIDVSKLTTEESRTANALLAQTFLLSQSAKTDVTRGLEVRNVHPANKNILDLFKNESN